MLRIIFRIIAPNSAQKYTKFATKILNNVKKTDNLVLENVSYALSSNAISIIASKDCFQPSTTEHKVKVVVPHLYKRHIKVSNISFIGLNLDIKNVLNKPDS